MKRYQRPSKVRDMIRKIKIEDKRVLILFTVACVFAILIAWRLVSLQILNRSFYLALASGQYEVYKELFPERGNIYLQDTLLSEDKRYSTSNLYPVALNRKYWQVYAVPYHVQNPEQDAEKLVSVLFDRDREREDFVSSFEPTPEKASLTSEEIEHEMDRQRANMKNTFLERLSKDNDPYEPIWNKASDELRLRVEELGLQGIEFAETPYRYYPEGPLGSHVVGFVGNVDGEERKQGLYGTEFYFDKELAGSGGYLSSERDVGGRLITISDSDFRAAVDGASVVLTVDHTLQNFICKKLDEALEKYEADSGSVIVMNPKTGAILSMCGSPGFDPNEYGNVDDIAFYNNPAIFLAYEPGSIFKPITMAAGIDLGKVEPETTYVDTGEVKVGGFTIKNSDLKAHGEQNMIEVLKQSLNTGVIFVVDQTGKEHFQEYVKRFGFGEKTGIQLPSENPGNIEELLYHDGIIYSYTSSFGQGLTVTPLQMVRAFSAIANGGVLLAPYIIDRVVYSNGYIEESKSRQIAQVISKRTATLLSGMLVSAIKDGHGHAAGVPGYHVAGKTGTAQVATGGVYGTDTIHSFVGYAPVSDPRFAMIVRLDHPNVRFAESSSAVVFGEIAKFILSHYQVTPDY